MSSCRGQKAGEKQGDSQRPETFFKFRPRGCSWRDGLRGSETVLLAICRPIAPSFFHLLSSLSLSHSPPLLTKHLSTGERAEIHPLHASWNEERDPWWIQLDFPSFVHESGSVTERKLGLLSSISLPTYRGLTRAGNRQRVVFHIVIGGIMMMMMMRLGNPSPRSLSQGKDCNTLLGDGNRCSHVFPLPDNLISRIRLYSYSPASTVGIYLEDLRGMKVVYELPWTEIYRPVDRFVSTESWPNFFLNFVCVYVCLLLEI